MLGMVKDIQQRGIIGAAKKEANRLGVMPKGSTISAWSNENCLLSISGDPTIEIFEGRLLNFLGRIVIWPYWSLFK